MSFYLSLLEIYAYYRTTEIRKKGKGWREWEEKEGEGGGGGGHIT